MNYPVDLSLFEGNSHSPSLGGLARSMGGEARALRDYCIPVNPYFPTPEFFQMLKDKLEFTLKFYPAYNDSIGEALGRTLGFDPRTLALGNGSTELITWINRLFVHDSLAIPIPTFSRWTDEPLSMGKSLYTYQRPESRDFKLTPGEFVDFVRTSKARAAVICNPNNPTGALMLPSQVLEVLTALSDLDLVVIDESFIDFASEVSVPSVAKHITSFPNAVVLKSLGKNFGLHGIRLGYAVGHPDRISKLRKAMPYWNVNALGELMIRELEAYLPSYESGRRQVVRDRQYLEARLREIPGLKAYPSHANFVYFKISDAFPGKNLRNSLLTQFGYLVRECGNKAGSSSQYFRVAARPKAEVDLLVEALRQLLS